MKMQHYRWLIIIIFLGAGLYGLNAAERKGAGARKGSRPALTNAAPVVQEPARPGYQLTVHLGGDEMLPFVWIGPMKMWAGTTEVSNGQFRRYDAGHDSTNVIGRDMDEDNQPVVHVSWDDANNYCGWLNRHYGSLIPTGAVFRLPTEQEWETYARCGDQRVYPWGNQWPPPNTYNYRGDEGSGLIYSLFQKEQFIHGHKDGYIVSSLVTQCGRNSWGLYGVGGNVWEWCWDWYDEKKETRAMRGGAWNNEQESALRVSHRASATPNLDNECIGFRVVIAPPPPDHQKPAIPLNTEH